MDSPTAISGLLHIRRRPGDTSDIALGHGTSFVMDRATIVALAPLSLGLHAKRSLLEHARDAGQTVMNVLLLSMPDYFEHTPPVAVRMPNGALTSLAGNVDRHHRVAVADLILCYRRVPETVTRLVREFDPEVVGLWVMTFQRRTAGRLIQLVRALKPGVKIVVGG